LAGAQPLTGTWQLAATAVSNTCAEPLGPRPTHTLAIVQAGELIAADSPDPSLIDFAGVVGGANVSVGFSVASGDALEIYDPALNVLTIASGTRLEGDLHWERFAPLGCTGTQSWSAERDGTGTPGDLSGDWTITAAELTESCGPIDPTALPIPAAIQQEDDLVRIAADVELGQTQWTGRVSGLGRHRSPAGRVHDLPLGRGRPRDRSGLRRVRGRRRLELVRRAHLLRGGLGGRHAAGARRRARAARRPRRARRLAPNFLLTGGPASE